MVRCYVENRNTQKWLDPWNPFIPIGFWPEGQGLVQVKLIQRSLPYNAQMSVQVSTVDAFQGKGSRNMSQLKMSPTVRVWPTVEFETAVQCFLLHPDVLSPHHFVVFSPTCSTNFPEWFSSFATKRPFNFMILSSNLNLSWRPKTSTKTVL